MFKHCLWISILCSYVLMPLYSSTDICSPRTLFECASCNCNKQGSLSPSCDSKGQCKCKEKFDGEKCTDRDCEMNDWSPWTPDCRCGYADPRTRSRSVRIQRLGKGKKCSNKTTDNSTCLLIPCDCSSKPGYRGIRCETRDCVLGEWGGWSNTCGCPGGICHSDSQCPTFKPKKTRTRDIKTKAEGDGKPCDTKRSDWDYCGHKCEKRCFGDLTMPMTCRYYKVPA